MSAELEGFATIPRAIQRDPDVTWQEKAVYLALSSRANARLQCWPSHATIAQDASVSVSTAKRGLESLRKRGLIVWSPYPTDDAGQTVNVYTLGGPDAPGSVGPTPRSDRPTPQVTQTQPLGLTDLLTIEENDGKEVDVAPDPVDAAFEEFWEAFPKGRRVSSKAKNLAKFRTAVKNGADPHVIVEAIKARVRWYQQEGTQPQHQKTSIPWLNGEHWEDEIVGLRAKMAPVADAYLFTENLPHREPTWIEDLA
jgi:hypothetical protein